MTLELLAGGALAAIVAVISAFFAGRRKGHQAEQDKQLRSRMKSRETADDIADAVAGREPGENRNRLRKWGPQ